MTGLLKHARWAGILAVAALALTACRAETQNKLRREFIDLANTTQYITVYSLDGKELFRGKVDGKVTRAQEGDAKAVGAEYVYWFDDTGKYWQTNMQYLVTTDAARRGQFTNPPAGAATTTGQ